MSFSSEFEWHLQQTAMMQLLLLQPRLSSAAHGRYMADEARSLKAYQELPENSE